MSDERCPKCAELFAQIDDLEELQAKLRDELHTLKNENHELRKQIPRTHKYTPTDGMIG